MMEPQESSVSACEDSSSLSQLSQLMLEEDLTHLSFDHVALRKHGSQASSHVWRERVAQWCYDVVDHLRESRSTVYVAMNILDRFFVQCPQNTSDRRYEAAALTALFVAVRIRGSGNLEVVDLVRMSRLGVTIREIVEVGKDITRALSFEHRLLTPSDFLQQLIKHAPQNYDDTKIAQVAETAGFYAELTTIDSFFAGLKASDIALASMLIALESDTTTFLDGVNSVPGVKFSPDRAGYLCERIQRLRHKTPGADVPHVIPETEEECDDLPRRHTTRVVSQEMICLKRYDNCTQLADLDPEIAPQLDHKRSVSPAPVSESKRQRIV